MTDPGDGPDPRRLANGTGYVGFAGTVLSLVLFFVPFLDLLLALVGLTYCGRAVALGRRRYLASGTAFDNGVALSIAGLILGSIGTVVGALISYDAAYRH